MKIVPIFANRLFAFVYKNNEAEGYQENEYDRLMELWTDTEFLWNYAKNNGIVNIEKFVADRLDDAETIQDLFEELNETEKTLDHYFQPLHDHETGIKILALKKGKTSKWDGLRLYAIKIDNNCFVITGGAIKMSQTMQDHPDTFEELRKIHRAQSYLKDNGVMDSDSFFEFLNEMR